MDLGIVTVGGIVALSFFVGLICKATPLDNKWIPVICGGSGVVLGILAFFCGMPDMPATDPINAAAIGFASGFAATGVHQVYKQLSTKSDQQK